MPSQCNLQLCGLFLGFAVVGDRLEAHIPSIAGSRKLPQVSDELCSYFSHVATIAFTIHSSFCLVQYVMLCQYT